MDSVNYCFAQESKLAKFDSAMKFIRDARQRQLNILYGRVPSGRLTETHLEIADLVQSAIALLQDGISTGGCSSA